MNNDISISYIFEFCAARKLFNCNDLRSNIHGNNFMLEVIYIDKNKKIEQIRSNSPLEVIDLWIKENFDYSLILYSKDPIVEVLFSTDITKDMRIYLLPMEPTSENLIIYLKDSIFPEILRGKNIDIKEVRLFEDKKIISNFVKEDSCY